METLMECKYSEYTVRITKDPTYWGPRCTQRISDLIYTTLKGYIESQFPGINVEVWEERFNLPVIEGPDENIREEIRYWIQENCEAAL